MINIHINTLPTDRMTAISSFKMQQDEDQRPSLQDIGGLAILSQLRVVNPQHWVVVIIIKILQKLHFYRPTASIFKAPPHFSFILTKGAPTSKAILEAPLFVSPSFSSTSLLCPTATPLPQPAINKKHYCLIIFNMTKLHHRKTKFADHFTMESDPSWRTPDPRPFQSGGCFRLLIRTLLLPHLKIISTKRVSSRKKTILLNYRDDWIEPRVVTSDRSLQYTKGKVFL